MTNGQKKVVPLWLHDTHVGIPKENYLTQCDLIVLEYIKVFGVAESKSEVETSKFKMVVPIWQTKIIKNV